jgi:hypothetical protein
MYYYARPALAKELTDSLRGQTLFGDAPNGLFLAAPRRTGKSTFLQNDLKPALEAAGVIVVYVDLWADRRRNPGALIAAVIGNALTQYRGFVARTAKAAGLENVSIAGIKIDTSRIGKIDGATLVDALKALNEAAKKPIALIVDEAQHSLTSEEGETAMSALKSARDQMNRPDDAKLLLVMSGSDRDKLLRLVNTNGAPFYGSEIHKMPALGKDFIEHCAGMITKVRPDLAPVNVDLLWEAFQLFGCRPQFFSSTLGTALNPLNDNPERFEVVAIQAAKQRQADDEAQMESAYLALKPIEQAILWRLLERGGERFRPYDADALKFYGAATGARVTAQQAQNAMETLRTQTPSLVWKSARGEYSLDDAMMYQWYQKRVAAKNWPPVALDDDLSEGGSS